MQPGNKSDSTRKFHASLILLTLCTGLLYTILFYVFPATRFSPATPYLILVFFAVTLLIYNILVKRTKKGFSKFTTVFMLMTTLKLMLFLVLIVAYSLLNRPDVLPFILTFFILYVLYSGFEVIHLLVFFRNPSSPSGNP